MVKRIIVTFSDDMVKLLDEKAERLDITRNLFITQICRKHLNMPNIFEAEKNG